MDARTRLQAEFEREAAEHEAALLLRLLRARARELSLGDLHAVLDSPDGARLCGHSVGELLRGPEPAVGRLSGEAELHALLTAVQRAARPVTASELDVPGCAADGREALLEALAAVGLVEALGGPPRLRYRIAADAATRPTIPVLVRAALVLAILRRSGRRMQLLELRRASGCSEERVRRAVQHLKRIRAVTCTGQNSGTRYGLAEAAPRETH